MHSSCAFKKRIAICFQDEKWVELFPKTERCWTCRSERIVVPTLGYTKRINCFITLAWPGRNIIWNCFKRRRNIEFRRHLSNVIANARRRKLKKVILFIDGASYHKTPEVKKFLKEHPVLATKFLPKKDPNSNPTECMVNKRLSSAVSVNRCHADYNTLRQSTRAFLGKYNSIYAT